MKKEPIYVIGHKNPDTDSIVSAIAYAHLLNMQGIDAIPCRLSELNQETKYILKRFDYPIPQLLRDARADLSEIEIGKPAIIHANDSIFRALYKIQKEKCQLIGVVDDDQKLIGIITKSDISKIGLGDTALGIDLIKETPLDKMEEVLNGKIVFEATKRHINGKISIIALTSHRLEKYEVKDRIVIIGDDPHAQIELIKKGAGALIIVWSDHVEKNVIESAKKYQCSIILSGMGSMNTSRFLYFSIPVYLIMQKNIVAFYEDELCEDVAKKMRHTTFQMYPVIDRDGLFVGSISRYHIMNARNKRIVMVDHNEFGQSVKGIEKAELVGVIDHHRIHDFFTLRPIYFRNEIIGSTATIITSMYKEKSFDISTSLASILLAAILSDTLNFRSVTTTDQDLKAATKLASISNLDIDAYANEIFSNTMHIDADIPIDELKHKLTTDLKLYEIENSKVYISQVLITSMDQIKDLDQKIIDAIKLTRYAIEADIFVVAFTSIQDNGSYLYIEGKSKNDLKKLDHQFYPDYLSRKNQLVPLIQSELSQL